MINKIQYPFIKNDLYIQKNDFINTKKYYKFIYYMKNALKSTNNISPNNNYYPLLNIKKSNIFLNNIINNIRKSNLTINMLIQIKNQITESYKEIINMQI